MDGPIISSIVGCSKLFWEKYSFNSFFENIKDYTDSNSFYIHEFYIAISYIIFG
jgi:hypothetical protein